MGEEGEGRRIRVLRGWNKNMPIHVHITANDTEKEDDTTLLRLSLTHKHTLNEST